MPFERARLPRFGKFVQPLPVLAGLCFKKPDAAGGVLRPWSILRRRRAGVGKQRFIFGQQRRGIARAVATGLCPVSAWTFLAVSVGAQTVRDGTRTVFANSSSIRMWTSLRARFVPAGCTGELIGQTRRVLESPETV